MKALLSDTCNNFPEVANDELLEVLTTRPVVSCHYFHSCVCLFFQISLPHGAMGSSEIYCKLGNFRKNIIFANSIKRHICDIKKSLPRHGLPISVNHSDFAILRGFYFEENSYMRSFA